jgi:hypothetical protein
MKKITRTIRGYTFPWYSNKEIVEIFSPDCREVIIESIRSLEIIIKEKEDLIIKLQDSVNKSDTDEFTKFFCREVIKMEHVAKLLEQDKFLLRLKNYWSLLSPTNKYIANFQEKLERARNFPIYEIASRYMELRQIGKDYTGLCPFHSEKHASFHLYTENNQYHCYGCGAHGDVIDLTTELCGTDFKGAVEILQN